MFSTIDNGIIRVFQWVIQQIELYSPFTRKTLFTLVFLTILMFNVLRVYVATNLMGLIPQMGGVVVFGFLIMSPHIINLYFLSKKPQRQDALPVEIETRRSLRMGGFISLGLGTVLYSYWLYTIIRDREDFLMALFARTLYCEVWLVLLIEYLLCTMSLPPGEKERLKQERLSKNAAVNAA